MRPPGRRARDRSGIAPGRSELGSPGINGWLWNATAAGGSRNGVLTAIEDFASERPERFELEVIEGMHGLAVLASEPRLAAAPALGSALERLRSPEFQRRWLAALERARIAAVMRAGEAERRRAEAERRGSKLEQRLLDEPQEGRDEPDTLAG